MDSAPSENVCLTLHSLDSAFKETVAAKRLRVDIPRVINEEEEGEGDEVIVDNDC